MTRTISAFLSADRSTSSWSNTSDRAIAAGDLEHRTQRGAHLPGKCLHPDGPRQRRSAPRDFVELYSALIGALSPQLDATFFALSDPTRRGILERLGGGPATLSQLALRSGLTLNGIKKHVGILELADLVETEKVGRARECRLGPAMPLGEAGEWIEGHRRAWEARLDRFESFVERAG